MNHQLWYSSGLSCNHCVLCCLHVESNVCVMCWSVNLDPGYIEAGAVVKFKPGFETPVPVERWGMWQLKYSSLLSSLFVSVFPWHMTASWCVWFVKTWPVPHNSCTPHPPHTMEWPCMREWGLSAPMENTENKAFITSLHMCWEMKLTAAFWGIWETEGFTPSAGRAKWRGSREFVKVTQSWSSALLTPSKKLSFWKY